MPSLARKKKHERNPLAFSAILQRPARATLFPYTTLFRSAGDFRGGLPGDLTEGSDLGPLPTAGFRVHRTRIDLRIGPSIVRASQFALDERESPDRKSTRLNSSHSQTSYAVSCSKKKTRTQPSGFFGNPTASSESDTLSLHDALPICWRFPRRTSW